MNTSASNPQPAPGQPDATQHVKDAHHLLQTLRDKLDKHPELEQAIEKLEEALNLLTVNTGGML